MTYPRPLTENDQRTDYPVELIALALEQTGVNYRLTPSDAVLGQVKALKQLGENRGVNVVWSMTDKDREVNLLPIRIPIYKGLIGWRVFLVKKDKVSEFSRIKNLQGLIQHKPIQGAEWPDTKILQSNGFDVFTSKSYTSLFSMLTQGQGDFFPRSLVEVWGELDSEDLDESLVVEPSLGIKYPTAMYLFVNRNNKTLARLLEVGLEKAIENGQFDELFNEHFAQSLERANMDSRFFYEINNPLLPERTPIERAELWY
ncbi:amino acid ABC transporter substrate-binding protein [Aliiglaciecola sp. M165]|nr:amino acid ABC transporter substrate-binding protein [Aliiglaciecola sp. M165]